MPLTAGDVHAAYALIFGRPPESEEAVAGHLALHQDLASLGRAFLASQEGQRNLASATPSDHLVNARLGLLPGDADLIRHHAVPPPPPEPGMITDFLGLRTRAQTVGGPPGLAGTVSPCPIPGDFHAEAVEWAALFKVMNATHGQLRMAELGAGWAPWTAVAWHLARRRGITDIRLYPVEADPRLFLWMVEHMRDNAVAEADLRPRWAVLGNDDQPRRWSPIGPNGMDYGSRPLGEGDADYRGLPVSNPVEVPGLALARLLAEEPVWDLIHMDLQGSEVELISANLPVLNARVRHMIFGTHSKSLDAECFEAFHTAGWICIQNSPPLIVHNPAASLVETMTVVDGTQYWRNPRLTG